MNASKPTKNDLTVSTPTVSGHFPACKPKGAREDRTAIGRRAFLGAGIAAVATAAYGAPAAAASKMTPATSIRRAKPDAGASFHRLHFEGEKAVEGPVIQIKQAEIRMIPVVDGKYNVWTKRVGNGGTTVLALHGGPGANHVYLESLESFLPPAGYELYYYDQLGCGYSDRPTDDSLWTVDRYLAEVEEVRSGLGLTDFVLYGHSWGGMLVQEYAIKHRRHLRAAVISNMTASMKSYAAHARALLKALPPNIQKAFEKFEAEKKYDTPEYQNLVMDQLYRRHLCRLSPWPEPVMRSFSQMNLQIYNVMQGPSEFVITGNFKDWDRWADLHKISVPTLVIGARHGTMSLDDIRRMGRLIPNSRVAICENGSHFSHFDDQEAYFSHLLGFLKDVDSGKLATTAG